MKKTALLLVLTLLCAMLSGMSALAEEPLPIRWIVYSQVTGETPTISNKTMDYLNERFNVDIQVVEMNATSEQWNIFWATDGKVDYIQTNHGSADIFSLVDNGMVRSIPAGWLDEYAPVLMENVYEKVSKEHVEAMISYNGENYIVPYTSSNPCPFGMIVRTDYMEKIGVTESPKTLEEFHELCRKLTFDDPDGNGIDDTYALDGVWQLMQFGYLTAQYGFWPGSFYMDEDGKVTYTGVYDEYKELLHLLKNWYDEGLIDPEFITDDRTDMHRKFAEGRVGIAINNHGWIANTIVPMLHEIAPDADVFYLQPFYSEDGRQYSHITFSNVAGDGSGFFGIDCSDEVMKKVLEIQNALVSDLDLYKRVYYGEEGIDYTVTDGLMTQTAEQKSAAYVVEHGLKQTFCVRTLKTADALSMQTAQIRETCENLLKNPKEDYVYYERNFVAPEVNKAYNEYYTEVNNVYWEFYNSAVIGKVDIDADWDTYLKDLEDAGLSEILDGYNAMFE